MDHAVRRSDGEAMRNLAAQATAELENAGATIRELRKQLAEYETLLRVIPIGISIAKDPECKVIVSNRHHASLLGQCPDQNTSIDPRAKDPARFRIVRDGVEIAVEELPLHRAIAEEREITDIECDVITNNGERLTFVGHGAPLFDEDHNVQGAVAAFANITERKRAEERLAASERKHRQLALENARLYEEAQVALRLRDHFVATVSHELRSPLAAIIGAIGILKSTRAEKLIDRASDIIERNALRQNRLIEDLLDLSRIATGQLRVDCREINLACVLNDSIQTLSTVAENSGVTLVSDIPPVAIDMVADADRLHQVVWNLISNAIKFAPNGEVRLDARVEGDEAVISVRDNGSGIDPEFLPHVFEQFRQAPGDRMASKKGIGLGLAIVRHIVELHGGRVFAESEGHGKGAKFVVSLPLRGPTNP